MEYSIPKKSVQFGYSENKQIKTNKARAGSTSGACSLQHCTVLYQGRAANSAAVISKTYYAESQPYLLGNAAGDETERKASRLLGPTGVDITHVLPVLSANPEPESPDR